MTTTAPRTTRTTRTTRKQTAERDARPKIIRAQVIKDLSPPAASATDAPQIEVRLTPPTEDELLLANRLRQEAITRLVEGLARMGIQINAPAIRQAAEAFTALRILIDAGLVTDAQVLSKVYEREEAMLASILQQVEEQRLAAGQSASPPVVPATPTDEQAGPVATSGPRIEVARTPLVIARR